MCAAIDKTKMGAGDGVRTPISQKRAPVPSSRRLATRCPSRDKQHAASMKQRLQEAIETLSTEHHSERKAPTLEKTPARRRAQTIAEITPSKQHGRLDKEMGSSEQTMTKSGHKVDNVIVGPRRSRSFQLLQDSREGAAGAAAEALDRRDAGRRVYEQLLLNAWRRRRRDATLLADSSNRLQSQVQQLQMQVDVLQQLRQAEGKRRSEAAVDNQQLRGDLDRANQLCEQLRQEKEDLIKQQETLTNNICNLQMDLVSEQEQVAKLNRDVMSHEKKVSNGLLTINKQNQEKELLQEKIKSLEKNLSNQTAEIRQLRSEIVNSENAVHSEMIRNKKHTVEMNSIQMLLKAENEQTSRLKCEISALEILHNKNVQKNSDLKKRVIVINEIKRRLLNENNSLKSTVGEMQIILRNEQEKPWWKTSGELMYSLLYNTAYLLLPALPPRNPENQDTSACAVVDVNHHTE